MERMLALLLACAAVPANAQQAPAPEPPVPPTAPIGDDLAFLSQEDRMTVPVRIDAAGPFPFIVDSGAQRSVISRQLASRLGLPPGPTVRMTTITGTSTVDTVVIPSLSVSTLGARRVEAPALDAKDMGSLGILGIDAMQDHALTIDFDQQRMTVTPAVGVKPPRPEPGEIVVRAKSLFGQLVVTNATVAGRRVRVVLDTGTSVSIGNLALRRLLTRRGGGIPIVFTSVTGDSITTDYASVPMLTLGSATIRALPVGFADARPFAAFGLEGKPALLLGMDVLRLFRRVHIDFARRELRLLLPRDAGRARVL
ncbi:MAG: aspartyl protease family protein [Sphingomonas phyllosphaerae]